MTDLDTSVPASVTLQCPSCGASAPADSEALADAAIVVCPNCGGTPTAEVATAGSAVEIIPAPARPPVLSNIDLVDAVRRPLVTYTDAPSEAWAAKLHADRPAPPVRERRSGSVLAAAACALFLVAFVGGRQAAVAAVPDLAGLYAMLGMPVNLYGLEISGVQAERTQARNGPASVRIRGLIVNVSHQVQPIPRLSIAFTAGKGVKTATEIDPPTAVVDIGAAAPFEIIMKAPPADSVDVVVRFASAPAGATGRLAAASLR